MPEGCYYAGQFYGPGAQVCMDGQLHRCERSGDWTPLGIPCGEGTGGTGTESGTESTGTSETDNGTDEGLQGKPIQGVIGGLAEGSGT